MVTPLIGREFDIQTLNKYFIELKKFADKNEFELLVAIEDLRALFGSAAGATFTFGFICGSTETVLIAHEIPYIKVNAKKWQAFTFQGVPEIRKPSKINKKGIEVRGGLETKQMALISQKRLYPNFNPLATERSKKPHEGIVDAIGIMHYIKNNY